MKIANWFAKTTWRLTINMDLATHFYNRSLVSFFALMSITHKLVMCEFYCVKKFLTQKILYTKSLVSMVKILNQLKTQRFHIVTHLDLRIIAATHWQQDAMWTMLTVLFELKYLTWQHWHGLLLQTIHLARGN